MGPGDPAYLRSFQRFATSADYLFVEFHEPTLAVALPPRRAHALFRIGAARVPATAERIHGPAACRRDRLRHS